YGLQSGYQHVEHRSLRPQAQPPQHTVARQATLGPALVKLGPPASRGGSRAADPEPASHHNRPRKAWRRLDEQKVIQRARRRAGEQPSGTPSTSQLLRAPSGSRDSGDDEATTNSTPPYVEAHS
ncbi:hypothetical protein TPAR_03598, partial [Tolypocladium paradoxum]